MTLKILILSAFVIVIISSCASTKQYAYFQKAGDRTVEVYIDTVEAPIQRNDILNIRITSLNSSASAEFNVNDVNLKGYLVDHLGNVQIPILGGVKAAGLTKSQLKESITGKIIDKKLLFEPIVEIRHMNFEVTILGEVNKPSVISVPSEQISLVKALGLAGDLTIYGKRNNVLLIREEDGKRITRHIDLTSSDFISSPYYYLKPNDVIYIEPNKNKITVSDKAWVIVPTVIGALTLLMITYATFVN